MVDFSKAEWRQRFLRQGLVGLYDEAKPGGPRSISDEQVAALIRKTLKTKPKDGTHWTCRSLAAETTISRATVHRIWRAFGLQPIAKSTSSSPRTPSWWRRWVTLSASI